MYTSGRQNSCLHVLSYLFSYCLSQIFAADFVFNQQHPDGQPLVSSFFGVPNTNAIFDYVVVGGGTGGLALASRLAAANLSIAVIEAGGFYETDNGNLSVVPANGVYFTGGDPDDFQPLVDWGIATTPQPGSNNRRVHYARGKSLGGSSSRNYYLYQRPSVDSLQMWADEVDDQSWTFDNLLPYFKRSTHFTPPNETAYNINSSNPYDAAAFQPNGGPLEVSYSNQVDALGTWCRKAFAMAGMPQLPGFNSGKLLGSTYTTSTIDPVTGYRSSSEASFLQTALNSRKAPIIYKNTLATEVTFNGRTATGVNLMTAGTYGTPSVYFNLTAKREVILSAGALQSPQLLMVSGIGNCSELAEFDIPCKVDLPGVGQNMWDHPIFGIAHAVGVNTASASKNDATLAAELVKLYLETRTGPLSIFGPGYYGFEKLPEPYRSALSVDVREQLDSDFPPDWPEIEWLPNPTYNGNNTNKLTADPVDGKNYATMSLALIAPLSRGKITLNSPHMWDLPNVDPQWFTAQADKEIGIQAFRRVREMWKIFVDLGIADPEEAYPGLQVETDEQILDWIGRSMLTVYHAAATNKMGKASEPMAVVDSNAFVYGTENLRIVDASAFPFLTPGHPQSMIYAFAEKIADMIIRVAS